MRKNVELESKMSSSLLKVKIIIKIVLRISARIKYVFTDLSINFNLFITYRGADEKLLRLQDYIV